MRTAWAVLHDRIQASWRTVRPRVGALANAADALNWDRTAAEQRRTAAVAQARVIGPKSWTLVERSTSEVREGFGHAVLFCEHDADVVAGLTAYVINAVEAGAGCLVIATASHRAGLRQRLKLAGLGDVVTDGRLIERDAVEVLASFLRDGWPDPELFDTAVAEELRVGCVGGARMWAFGEMVGLLVAQDNLAAALQLEKLWDALQQRVGFPLLCAYADLGLPEDEAEVRDHVLARHSHQVAAVG